MRARGALSSTVARFRRRAGTYPLEGLDLDVREGETIGLAGMEGSGQSLLLKACAGPRPARGRPGRYSTARDLTGKPYHSFKRRGVAYVPAARLEEGLIPGLTLTDHFLLTQREAGLLHRPGQGPPDRPRSASRSSTSGAYPRAESNRSPEATSSGRCSRWSSLEPGSLLLEHPTRGLDIESVIYLWGKLKERCNKGGADHLHLQRPR